MGKLLIVQWILDITYVSLTTPQDIKTVTLYGKFWRIYIDVDNIISMGIMENRETLKLRAMRQRNMFETMSLHHRLKKSHV